MAPPAPKNNEKRHQMQQKKQPPKRKNEEKKRKWANRAVPCARLHPMNWMDEKKKQEKKCSSGPAPLQTRPTEDEDEQGHFEFLFFFK